MAIYHLEKTYIYKCRNIHLYALMLLDTVNMYLMDNFNKHTKYKQCNETFRTTRYRKTLIINKYYFS